MNTFEKEMDKRLGTGIVDPPGEQATKPAPNGGAIALPVKAEETNSPLVPLVNGQVPTRRMVTSLDPKDPAQGILAYRAQQDHDVVGDDWINKEILVEHWLMHDYQHIDAETGQVHDRVRTVLISPDGQRYGFSSVGIANSVRAICQFVRPAPWRPPIKVKLVAKRSGESNRYFTLDLIA